MGIWNEIRRIEDRIVAICFAVGRNVSDRQVASDDFERERSLGSWGLGVEVGVGVVDERKPTDQPKRRMSLGLAGLSLWFDFDIGRGVSVIIDVLNVR